MMNQHRSQRSITRRMQLVQAARAVVTMSSGQPSVAVLTRSAIAESQELSGLLLVLVVLIIVVLLLTSGSAGG